MKYEIQYKPAFASIFLTINPGEKITAEAGAMISMDSGLTMTTEFSGGFFSALLKSLFGGESLFVNIFKNNTQKPLQLVLSQSTIGDIVCINLEGGKELCLQPGGYIAHTTGVNIAVAWAGFKSWFSGEGLFKLKLSGNGRVFFGCYGGISEKYVDGEFVVDTSHLVAYPPNMSINVGLAGGLLGSMTSGEGFVMRLKGKGTIYLQSRSIDGLVKYLSPKVRG